MEAPSRECGGGLIHLRSPCCPSGSTGWLAARKAETRWWTSSVPAPQRPESPIMVSVESSAARRPTRAEVLERRSRVIELTHAGRSDDDIAVELGYANRSGVWKARQRALVHHEAGGRGRAPGTRAGAPRRPSGLSLGSGPRPGSEPREPFVLRIIQHRIRLLGLGSGSADMGLIAGATTAPAWRSDLSCRRREGTQ